METHRNDREPGRDNLHTLAAIARDLPPWHAWEGAIAGLVYARRPGSSPPMCVRSTTVAGLRQEIEAAERRRGLRR